MKVSLLKAVAFTVLQAVHGSAHEAVSTKDIQGVAVGAAEYVVAEGSRRKNAKRIINDPGRRRGDWWYDVENYDDCMDICKDETSWSQNKCENKCLDLTGDIARGRNKIRRNSGRRRRRRNGNDDDDDKWEDDDRNRDFDDDGCGPGRAFKRSSSTRSGCKPSASTKRAVKRNNRRRSSRNRRRRCNGKYCDDDVTEEGGELTETATTVAATTTKASKEDAREARKAEREANRGSKSTKSPSAFESAIA